MTTFIKPVGYLTSKDLAVLPVKLRKGFVKKVSLLISFWTPPCQSAKTKVPNLYDVEKIGCPS